MEVDDEHVGIGHEPVEHAVPVMGIDVHVGDALQAVFPAQIFDGHAAIVEHAESGGPIASGMMQAGNGREGPAMGVKARRPSPARMRSIPARVVPTTRDAASKMPGTTGVSP